MHLGKPLLRRTVTPRPEALPEPVRTDDSVTVAGEDAAEPEPSEPQTVS
jgi:hypothetical protein